MHPTDKATATQYWHIVNGKTYKAIVGEYPSMDAYRAKVRSVYGNLTGVRFGMTNLDRRDDITKPDTTYSFPPRTA